jgi:hypothetical protein
MNGYPNIVFKKGSNYFVNNIKETVDVTLAADDDRHLKHKTKTSWFEL